MKFLNLGVTEEQEKRFSLSDLEDGKIVLDDFPGATDNGMQIQARIKYLGFESWSPWISTENPVNYFILKRRIYIHLL